MTSGCASDNDLNNTDNVTTENTLSEVDQIEADDSGLSSEDTGATENILPEAVQVEPATSEDAVVEETTDQSSDPKIQESVPQVSLQASKLGDGVYLLEHQSGDDMDLAKVRLILSSDGQTQVYSQITENSEIMTAGDKLNIDTNSGIFTLNGNPVDVTDPESTESSLSTTNMMFIHVASEQIIAYITLN
ncbi:hypothetical protein RE476_02895 [Methanolobus mangrovi]|uniref:Uncharacterized protein n=1 Tax=Methanolobus mangrovi TaxID=3072977 RepID=A0AA51YH47_9EURY|nr:hypothetical protein [Methanolobus mangrovi]WMW22787.1 hypothetical protein RE476_02895 [Methanolobus mangrovi]